MLGRRITLIAAAVGAMASLGAAGPLPLLAPPTRSAPSATVQFLGAGYRRKDRFKNAAQVKRASKKARNVAKHRRHA